MTANKRRKSSRQRGSSSHGHGHLHRGHGNSAGRGKSGSGKFAQGKKRSFPAHHLSRPIGFISKGQAKDIIITIRDLETMLPQFEKDGIAKQSGSAWDIDLTKTKFTKLLASGKATKKMKIKVSSASEGCAEKLKTAGGELVK